MFPTASSAIQKRENFHQLQQANFFVIQVVETNQVVIHKQMYVCMHTSMNKYMHIIHRYMPLNPQVVTFI